MVGPFKRIRLQLAAIEQKLQEHSTDIEKSHKVNVGLEECIAQLSSLTEQHSTDLEKSRQANVGFEDRIAQLTSLAEQHSTDLENSRQESAGLEERLVQLTRFVEQRSTDLEKSIQYYVALQEQCIHLESLVEQYNVALANSNVLIKAMQERLIQLASHTEHLQNKCDDLETAKIELSQKLEGNMLNVSIQMTEREKENAFLEQEIGQCSKQLKSIDETLSMHRSDHLNDHWNTKYGYDSLIANLQLSVVEQTVPGNRKRLMSLENMHQGKKCFIIGNGPSLRVEDLNTLTETGVFSFASKRINSVFDQTPWRPDIWAASDLDFIRNHQEEISSLTGFIKMLPCQTVTNLNMPMQDAVYFPFIQMERLPAWFNQNILNGIHFYGTITIKMINIAVYMGFKEIYLLGVDHSYPIHRGADGKAVYDTNERSHFTANYQTPEERRQCEQKAESLAHGIEVMDKSFHDVKYYCDQLSVRIINATRGGKLEIFPRESFEDVILGINDASRN